MLEARSVTFRVKEKRLVAELSLCISPGEFVVVVGANGAGKSTLLKVLAGELVPGFGTVYMNNVPLHHIPLQDQAKTRAVLPQDASLHFPFKVDEVVAMGRSPHTGSGLENDQRIIDAVLHEVDAQDLRHRDYTTLSGGERQRVQMARVLAQIWDAEPGQARYLLLDEPTSALDLAHQHATLATANRMVVNQNIGVLAILHDLNLAAYYADRIAILKDGHLLCQGTPREVLTPGRISEAFDIPAAVLIHPLRDDCPLVVTPVHSGVNINTMVAGSHF